MTATAATFLIGFATLRPPSSWISSTTVIIFRIFMPSPPSDRFPLVTASRGSASLDDLGGAGRRRRVAAPADPDLPVDEHHGNTEEIAGLESLKGRGTHRADRRVHDAQVRLAAGFEHAHGQPVHARRVAGGH